MAAGEFGDGFVSTAPDSNLVEMHREEGDDPRYGQLTVCYDESESDAKETAHEWWPNSAVPGELGQLLPTPKHFEQATKMVTVDDVAERVLCDPDPDAHIEAIEEYVDADFDHVYVHQVGTEQREFIEFYADDVMPSFG